MLRKKIIRWLTPAVCICILCTGQVRASSVQNQLSNTGDKINELENELNRADQNISAYQQEQKILENDISTGQAKISQDQTLAAIKEKQTEIEQTGQELKQSEKECKLQYEQMKIRIRFMYENSLDSMLTQILESGSISEALQRAEYFQSVVSYDRKKLDEYKATTRKIAETKKQLVAEEESLLELEKEQSSQLEEIDSAVNELKNSLREKLDQIQN